MIVLVVATSWLTVTRIETAMREEISASIWAVLQTTNQAVRSWSDEERAAALSWAGSTEVMRLAQELAAVEPDAQGLSQANAQEELRGLLAPVLAVRGYQRFFVLGPGNVNLGSTRDENLGVVSLLARHQDFLARVWSGEAVMSPPQPSTVALPDEAGVLRPDQPTMFVGAPIFDENGSVFALLAFRVDPKRDFARILERGRIGITGESYAFDSQARLISDSRYDDQLRQFGLIEKNLELVFTTHPDVPRSLVGDSRP